MKYICCICGKEFDDFGNNPYPLCDPEDYESKCCDDCNRFVIEARMMQMTGHMITEKDIEYFKELAIK